MKDTMDFSAKSMREQAQNYNNVNQKRVNEVYENVKKSINFRSYEGHFDTVIDWSDFEINKYMENAVIELLYKLGFTITTVTKNTSSITW